jgi:hypothetical protein
MPSCAEVKKNFMLFQPFILSFLLLMEHLFILNRQQLEANFLWVGSLAILFSAATIATYCKPKFRQCFLASVPIVSVCIGLLMLWNLFTLPLF